MKRILLLICLCAIPPTAIADDESVARYFPEQTPVFMEVSDLSRLLTTILEHPLRDKIEALPQYQEALKSEDFRSFRTMRKVVEIQIGMDWQEAIMTLTRRGIAVGFDPATQGVAVLLQGDNSDAMERVISKLVDITIATGNNADIESKTYRDRTCYKIKGGAFALIDDVLLVVNKAETGREMIDRLLDGDPQSLEQNPRYQEAQERRRPDSTVRAFIDADALRGLGVAYDQLNTATQQNPLLEVVAGGIVEAVQSAPWVVADLTATPDAVHFHALLPHDVTRVSEERDYYFGPNGSGRSPQVPVVGETLFTLAAWRDVSEMWLRADDLFSGPVVDGFAKANAGLTTLFAGNDFSEDILGAVRPEIAFVAVRRNFDRVQPRPAIQLPAMALSLKFRDAAKSPREFRRTFQTMIGFFNVIRAMEGGRQLELDMELLEGNAQLVTSTYVPEDGEEESAAADLVYNFEPTVGFNGDRFIVATTKELARQLTLATIPQRDSTDNNTQALLDASVLQNILADNREQLIAQNMLSDGNTRPEAEAAIDLLLEFVTYFQDTTFTIDSDSGALSVGVTIRVAE